MLATTFACLAVLQTAPTVLESLQTEAKALQGWAKSTPAAEFLAAVPKLPAPGKRVVFQDEKTKTYYAADDGQRKRVELSESFYYYTKYGSPLAYLRPIEILGQAGLPTLKSKKALDFGYGGIGPLRLFAECGGEATGVDIDSLLKAVYSQPDDLAGGRIKLVEGFFPTDAKVLHEIGGNYDVFLSKNTLKRGYVHPEREVDKRLLVDLGVSDVEFCKAVAKTLKKGGLFLIYNLSPAQNPSDKPYLPWADGRSPFSKPDLEAGGFDVLAYDVNDDSPARELGRRLGWDKGANPMNFEKDLFGHYTLCRKR